jgi:penicillin-insensitive murein DD-endopeptidase
MLIAMARVSLSLVLIACVALLLCARSSWAEAGSMRWHEVRLPAKGPAEAIGGYSAGCVRGAQALPQQGPGYQIMRPSRRRGFGHPTLIDFLRKLGSGAKQAGLSTVLIGDLGQARGGPAPSGHASHQSGLDVDIWYWAPDLANTRPLTRREREQIAALSIVDEKAQRVDAEQVTRVEGLLAIAARDERVTRIFVNPVIKHTLCQRTYADRSFLNKLRPWWGHDDHFHVRLACPAESKLCESQAKVEAGDGCAEVASWLTPEALAAREKEHQRYRAKVGAVPKLPEACEAILNAP